MKSGKPRQYLNHALGSKGASHVMAKHYRVNSSTPVRHLSCNLMTGVFRMK